MSDIKKFTLDSLQPGSSIQFSDATELHAFEDLLAPLVDSSYNAELWSGRTALNDLWRPEKFNGRITDLQLTVMSDPHDRLLDARERGWTIIKGRSYKRTTDETLNGIKNFVGFTFTGMARSTGRGNVGQIQAELWYGPNPKYLRKFKAATYLRRQQYTAVSGEVRTSESIEHRKEYEYITSPAASTLGRSLVRAVTHPKIEKEKFIELQESSKRIAFDVLRHEMMRPISNGMHN